MKFYTHKEVPNTLIFLPKGEKRSKNATGFWRGHFAIDTWSCTPSGQPNSAWVKISKKKALSKLKRIVASMDIDVATRVATELFKEFVKQK